MRRYEPPYWNFCAMYGSHRRPALTVRFERAFQLSCTYIPTTFVLTGDLLAAPCSNLESRPSMKSTRGCPVALPLIVNEPPVNVLELLLVSKSIHVPPKLS